MSSERIESNLTVNRLTIASGVAAASLLFGAATSLRAQIGFQIPSLPSGPGTPPKTVDRYPEGPSAAPASTIPFQTLGFSAPGDHYLLRQQSVVSLDFVDEDRLLFTFHVSSGLMARRGEGDTGQQRIRAMVIVAKTGKVESQIEWMVPDRSRYLWMLNDGRFLVRVKDGLDEGMALAGDEPSRQIRMKSYLRLPGKLMWIQMDPKQEYMITNSLEPPIEEEERRAAASAAQESTAARDPKQHGNEQGVLVARTMRRDTGEVLRTTRTQWTSQTNDWPMNSQGYLERVHEKGAKWALKLSTYMGTDGRVVGRMDSTCLPKYSFVSDTELLMSRCDPEKGLVLEAFSSSGESMWERKEAANAMWPLLVTSRNGSRVARERLLLKRSMDKYKRMIGAEDLLGQTVKVFDAASGKVLLDAPLTPVFDGGGNVALSPSGRRLAILNAGAIQVYELPAAATAASH